MFDIATMWFAQWRLWALALQRPAVAQECELLKLVDRAQATRFGREHHFSSITSVAEYQARVPLRQYEEFWDDYWSDTFPVLEDCTWPGTIPYFALTSGTTSGNTKHIPVTHEMLDANNRAIQDLLCFHLISRPWSRIGHGKGLMLGGSTDLRELAPGIHCGDLSGIEAKEVPSWARSYVFPPPELALLDDWEEKIDQITRTSLKEDIRAVSGTPNWLLMFFDKLMELRPELEPRIVNFYPNLELVIHGGVDFKPYAMRYSELLEGSHAELREVYPASEAFIAVADRGPNQGLRLLADNRVFFEFVPVEELESAKPSRHWLENVQQEVNYAVVLTTCAGLWSYVLGDTVKFVGLEPPRLVVTGRTTYWLSAFGEHLINAEIEEAMAFAAGAIGRSISDYCVAPIYPSTSGETGRHCFVVECVDGPLDDAETGKLAGFLDARLQTLNADYERQRRSNLGLSMPEVRTVTRGALAAWMKGRGMLGGQHKVPRIINDRDLFQNLMNFLASHH